ncbi:MAG TPA: hypothetical protein PKA27_05005 [Fimbriimonadaceae bacterium]|nr:hypothetical protein [Fimbriimonadaceae bacterium]
MRLVGLLPLVLLLLGCGEPAPTPAPIQQATINANLKKQIDKETPGPEPADVAYKIGHTILEVGIGKITDSGVTRLPLSNGRKEAAKTSDGEKVTSHWIELKDFRIRVNFFGPLSRGISVVGESLNRDTFSMEWFDWIDGKLRQRVGSSQIRVEMKAGKPWRLHFDEGLDIRVCPYTGRDDVGNPIWLFKIHKGSFFTIPN